MATTSVDGLSSGIKWNDIIDAMVKADRASTAVQEKRKADIQGKLDAVRTFNAKLLTLQLDASSLNRPSLFNSRTATSSNEGALGVTATSTATPGSYAFDVVTVARAHQTATAGTSSSTANLGDGTVNIQIGSGATTSLTIGAGSSSLDSIASAINGAGIGVTASVVNSGSGATPYRLIVTSTATGAANAVTISTSGNLATGIGAFTTTQAATDAQIRVGTGGSAVTVSQATNTFVNVLPGITLTAKQDNVSGVTVSVGSNTGDSKAAIKSFVESYNGAVQYLIDNASYDPTSKKAGVLFSESDVRSRFQTLTTTLISPVKNLPLDLSTLSSVGISIDRSTGKLALDESQLDAKLSANSTGVMKIFTNSGVSSDPGIRFSSMTDKTKATNPFTVSVTQIATQAAVSSTSNLGNSLVVDGTNKDMKITVNGRDYTFSLTAGTYTQQQLADHLQAVLSQKITNNADRMKVSIANNRLSLNTLTYGSGSTIAVDATSTANSLLALDTTKRFGADAQGKVNGTFVIGTGQVLRGAEGTDAEGLALTVSATAPITSATITASKGLIQQAGEKLNGLTDSVTGAFTIKEDGLQTSIDRITDAIAKADARMQQRKDRYTRQFQTMERLMNASNSLGNMINGQIKGFENMAKGAAG